MNYIKFIFSLIQDTWSRQAIWYQLKETYKLQGLTGIMDKSYHVLFHSKSANELALSKQKLYNKYTAQKPDIHRLKNNIQGFKYLPKISIVMPTYNSNPDWLSVAIESVKDQIYPYWELCIADDASTNEECKNLLKKYEKEDHRIQVVFRNQNGHISNASNSALEMVSGDFVALLDHDDKLPEDALYWIAKTINEKPNVSLIYSDEDKFDKQGIRSDPYFKCDWNYSLFLSQNMISHLGVYKTSILKKIGGFRQGYEGSQDYDLALRFIEQIDPNEIAHIPRILYHWRIHKNSTAYRTEKKPYAITAAQHALSDHLSRKKINATVEILKNQMYRVKYKLPSQLPSISIIIPSRNNFKILKKCLHSITNNTDYSNYEILIIDNNSDDIKTIEYLDELKSNPIISIIYDKRPFNYSAINNKATKNANGDYLCFLNDDTEVISSNWLSEMLSINIQDGVGIVGAKLWFPNKTLQHGGIILGIGGIASSAHKYSFRSDGGYFNRASLIQEFSAVTAACMLISRKVFEQLGGFNETLEVAYNDIDLCLRAREMNYRIIWTPFAELYHHESVSRGADTNKENNIRFQKEVKYMNNKWRNWIENDPAYSPNLTLIDESFSMAWPSRLKMERFKRYE